MGGGDDFGKRNNKIDTLAMCADASLRLPQCFITFMDALKLNLKAKDQLHPFLTELMTGYSKFRGSAEWEGRAKILHWLIELNAMKASDEITDEQSRQVSVKIEKAVMGSS